MNSKTWFGPAVMASVMALSVAQVVEARVISASASGRVTDTAGARVANARVEVLHEPSGTLRIATTDSEGRFNLRGLRVGGPYRITVSRDGYNPAAIDNQFIDLEAVSNIDLVLERGSATMEEVVVTGARGSDPIFDGSRMGAGTLVNRQTIEALPSIARNIQDYVRTDPRISQVDKERGEISAGGQNTRFNNIRIDGVSTNDAFGLEANNLPTARQPINIDAIESIKISLSNYDVSLGGYTGASVDAVTKSGTNEFSGSAYAIYRDSDWTGKRDGNRFDGFQDETTFGVTLGGPIIQDKLFFFAAYEQFTRSAAAPIFGPRGSGAGQEVAGIGQEEIEEIRAIATNVWGFDAGSFAPPGSLDTDIKDIMLKIDWNISDEHRASFRYNKTEQDEPFLRNIGARQLSLSSFWHVNNKEFSSLVGQLYSDWNQNFSTEVKFSYSEQKSLWDIGEPLPSVRVCLNSPTCAGSDSVWLGTERFRQVNILETETWDFFAAGTYFAGDHELKFGFEYQSRDIFNLFGRDQFGVYEFSSIEDFRNGTPESYALFYPVDGNVNTRAAEFTLGNWSVFLQDTWQVNDHLSLTYGLRLDVPVVDEDPAFNPAASAFFGIPNNSTVDGNRLWQPRFGFNYTPDTERMTQIRGGVGLFQGIAANVWLANPYTNNNVNQGAIFDFNPAVTGILFSPDPNNQPGQRPPPGLGGNIDIVDPSLRLPSVWKANIGVDHELPWYGVVATAEVLFTETKEAIYYVKPNLGAPTGVAPDGRPIYWRTTRPGEFTGAAGQATANFNRDFGVDSTIARPTSEGRGRQFTVSLQGAPHENWFWNVAYTRTRATEVNSLTSSQAASNWNNTIRADRNLNRAENSIFAIRDRFSASLSYQNNFFSDLRTSFGLFYEGRSGRPFTYTFINDANGDRRAGVDPFYVPAGRGDVLFTGGPAMEDAFFAFLESEGGLRRQQGQIAGINTQRSSWVNQFDVRISQEVPGIAGFGRGEIWLEMLNVGNFINKSWGQIKEVGFPYGFGVARFEGVDPDSGRYVYSFNRSALRDEVLRDQRGESRWALQAGVRYKF